MAQLTVRIPNDLLEALDDFVDGIRFRSRAHLIQVILAEWLDEQDELEAEEDQR